MNSIPAGYVEVSPGVFEKIKNAKNLSHQTGIPDSKQCECSQTLASGDEGEAQGSGLLHVRFTLARKSLLDVDAKYASVKDLLDCLVIARIVDGDKEGQITLEVIQRKINKHEKENTEIEVFKVG